VPFKSTTQDYYNFQEKNSQSEQKIGMAKPFCMLLYFVELSCVNFVRWNVSTNSLSKILQGIN